MKKSKKQMILRLLSQPLKNNCCRENARMNCEMLWLSFLKKIGLSSTVSIITYKPLPKSLLKPV